MALQLLIGTILILATVAAVGAGFWLVELWIARARGWLVRRPHRPRLFAVLAVLATWVVGEMTIAVWLWALVFYGLDLFDGLEPAVYFALVSFTTLGFGDILLPPEWRLLGGLAAANGLLNFGVSTALLVEIVRGIRIDQIAADQARK